MKALTVMQPWADAILNHGKIFENRGVRFKHRGKLIIHAGKGWSVDGQFHLSKLGFNSGYEEVRGAIVGVVDVVDCVDQAGAEKIDAAAARKWFLGPYALVLSNPRRITPIACSGAQGLWNVNGDIAEKVAEELEGK